MAIIHRVLASYFLAQKSGPNTFGLTTGLRRVGSKRREPPLRSQKNLKKVQDFPGPLFSFMIHCYQ